MIVKVNLKSGKILHENPVNMIQIRNLNIDPDAFTEIMPPFTKAIGTKEFIRQLHEIP